MRILRSMVLGVAMLAGVASLAHADPRTEKEKRGALKERKDPAADLKLQKENVEKLRENVAIDKKAGNKVGAWAAERDEKHAEKLIKKDEKLIDEGQKKAKTEDEKK